MGGGQSTPRCPSLDLVLPLLTVIVKRGSLRACVTVSCPPVYLVAVCLDWLLSLNVFKISSCSECQIAHFLLKFEQYPTVWVGHSLLCSFIGWQILEWQFGGYRSHLEHFEQPHTCFGGVKFLSLGPPQVKNRSHHIEILGLIFKSPPDWFVFMVIVFCFGFG